MPPGKLDPSVLLALGLLSVAGCGDKDDTGDTGDTGNAGPCLDYATESLDAPAAAMRAAPTTPSSVPLPEPTDRAAVTRRVLARGVLPADVAALLEPTPLLSDED
jgi:hypothetical protein